MNKPKRYVGTWVDQVTQWANDRNIIKGSTPAAQYEKLLEEATELYSAVRRGNRDEAMDAIGDCAVVLCILSAQHGCRVPISANHDEPRSFAMPVHFLRGISDIILGDPENIAEHIDMCVQILAAIAFTQKFNFEVCKEIAWEEIKDRRGRMVNQVFVKEEG